MHEVEIKVKGQIDAQWSEWLDSLAIARYEEGETVLVGRVVDQAALHGLLAKVRDLGLSLVSVNSSEVE